ncbi:MAG TPA: hypothetical protein EYQ35_01885 [candidate division UBP10 bacterium]|nr:hypothetical protein [Candidatus Binatota bacterium]
MVERGKPVQPGAGVNPAAAWFARRVYSLLAGLVVMLARVYRRTAGEGTRRREEIVGRLAGWTGDVGLLADLNGCTWVHAASVGEVQLARPLLARLAEARPDLPLLLTCNTATGLQLAVKSSATSARFFPFDSSPIMARVLDALKPSLFVFVETEIWPCLLNELAHRKIPSVMVNARVSKVSFPRYRRVRWLVGPALAGVNAVLARDRKSADRLGTLGAVAVTVVGDLKHDGLAAAEVTATPNLLAAAEGSLPVLVAASTREGEEELVLAAFEGLRDRARLVVAPRHSERTAEVEGLLVRRGMRYKLLGEGDTAGDWEVLVIDTVGKLRGFFAAARAVFVGGSLVDKGGHNLLEPAAYATAVCAGSHLDNVQDQSAALLAGGGIELVADTEALAAVWNDWVDDENKAAQVGEAARDVVRSSGGALDATMAVLEGLL